MSKASSQQYNIQSLDDLPKAFEEVSKGKRPEPWDRETPFGIVMEQSGLDYELLGREEVDSLENDHKSWREREIYSLENPEGGSRLNVVVEYIVGAEYEQEEHLLETETDVQNCPADLDLNPESLPTKVVYEDEEVPKATTINYTGTSIFEVESSTGRSTGFRQEESEKEQIVREDEILEEEWEEEGYP